MKTDCVKRLTYGCHWMLFSALTAGWQVQAAAQEQTNMMREWHRQALSDKSTADGELSDVTADNSENFDTNPSVYPDQFQDENDFIIGEAGFPSPGDSIDDASDAFEWIDSSNGGVASAGRPSDIALILPEYVVWHLDRDQNAKFDFQQQWGLPGDQFLAGEPLSSYQDGYDELVVVRGSDWYVKINDGRPGFSGRYVLKRFCYGRPIIADFNGDGRDEAACATESVSSRIRIDRNGNLAADSFEPLVYWGVSLGASDHVLAGSLGSRFDEIAIWRNATGMWELYTTYQGSPTSAVFARVQFGLPGDLPFLADLNGDDMDDFCVFRPSNRMVYVNYFEPTAGKAGYGPNGDVDRIIDYSTAISRVNQSVWLQNETWNVAALGVNLD